MNRKEALNQLIKTIYNSNSNLVISEKDIKKINNYFKGIENFNENIENFFEKNSEELSKVSKLKSGKYEIEKQYTQKKALQPGILSECNYIETLARILKLNKCLDFDKTPLNKIPLECRNYINSGYQTFSAARYLYYNPKNPNMFIFQYGNPASGDAEIIIDENKVRLEFKERNAKAGEYDITGLYNDDGKLLISEDFRNKTPEYIPFIEKFNKETSVIEQIGHNYNNFDEETKIASIIEYFTRHDIDAIVSSTNENELVIITPECVKVDLPNGKRIITTENSEIRISGRNHGKIFTQKIFKETLKQIKAQQISDGKYEIHMDNKYVEIVKGRGSNIPTRIKINKIFFIEMKNIQINDDKITFDIKDVRQLRPSISMHIKLNASKDELSKYYDTKKA